MELIVTIIIAFLIKWIKDSSKDAERPKREKKQTILGRLTKDNYQNLRNVSTTQTIAWQSKARENIAKVTEYARQKKEITTNQQIRKRQMENKNKSILERAKKNVEEEINDKTLYQVQKENSECVSQVVDNYLQDFSSNDILETVSDLMIKGYDGTLCFERDFLGEAMDMIGRFQPPTEIPDSFINL